jgi:glycosyltransferase involved in cell wall biosynthesis
VKRKGDRPKVVIFSTVHQATDDRIFHKEARSLARAGYNVVILASHPRKETISGVRIKSLARPASRFRRILLATAVIWKVLREGGDLFHFHDPELIPTGLLLRLIGKKVIYDSHEDLPKDVLLKPYLPRWAKVALSKLARLFESLAAPLLSGVIVPSQEYSPHIPFRTVVHNYPMLEYIYPAAKARPSVLSANPFLVYCGTINSARGAREMLRSVEAAGKRVPVRLRLLGPVEDEELRSEIASCEAKGIVEYRGQVPHKDVFGYCVGAVAGLLLYHPAPMHELIVPIKLFELMACGVPVIAAELPFFRKIVREGECGLLVDPLNVPQVADAIVYLIEHPEEARKMGQRGKELVEKSYTWQSEERELLGLYRALLQR